MKPTDDGRLERVRQDAQRILQAMNDTPIPATDATFYQHYAEELLLIVEDFLAIPAPERIVARVQVWLIWDCDVMVDCYATGAAANAACADVQHRLMCEYGSDTVLLESITVTTALLPFSGTIDPDPRS